MTFNDYATGAALNAAPDDSDPLMTAEAKFIVRQIASVQMQGTFYEALKQLAACKMLVHAYLLKWAGAADLERHSYQIEVSLFERTQSVNNAWK